MIVLYSSKSSIVAIQMACTFNYLALAQARTQTIFSNVFPQFDRLISEAKVLDHWFQKEGRKGQLLGKTEMHLQAGDCSWAQDDLINQSIFLCFCCRHEEIPVCVFSDFLERLACKFGKVPIESKFVVEDFISLDLDVSSLPLSTTKRLMDHDSGVG